MEETVSRIYGIHALEEALNSGMNIAKVFAQSNQQHSKVKTLLNACANQGATISYVPLEKLQKLAKGRNHQGIVANIAPVGFVSLEELIEKGANSETPPLFILLDQISDVRNFGAIIRSAVAANATGIIVQKKGGAPVNADTVKTSAGAIFKIPISKVDHIKDALFHFQAEGIPIIAATEKGDASLYKTDLKGGFALIMGSEGRGINPSVLKLADTQLHIPISDHVDSLNVAVASAVILFEAQRQRSI